MRAQYGVSPWIDEFPRKKRPDFPRYRGSATYPVAIIGGGLTGCCTAYAFAAAGIGVAVFEADRLGSGGGGRGPGVFQGEAASQYRVVEARLGRRGARATFELSRRAVLDLAATVRRLGIKGRVDTHDAARLLASYASEEKPFRREFDSRIAAGLDAMWLKSAAAVRESGVENARAGVRFRDWGQGDPYRLILGFANAAAARGAAFFARSPVTRVKMQRKGVALQVNGQSVSAETVVVCTGVPTALYRPLIRHVKLTDRYIALTEHLSSAIRKLAPARTRVLADADDPPHVVRWTDDGRVLIAGADQAPTAQRVRDKVLAQRTGQLMYELSRLYPGISGARPAYGWHLPLATAADGLMLAGPHRNYPHHLFAWATRHDPAQAYLASRILLRHYQQAPDREDLYFAFTRG
ncbi:MAG: NAD(P)/FAD-dependent oxidoreductase [Acidobacteriota bacterium]